MSQPPNAVAALAPGSSGPAPARPVRPAEAAPQAPAPFLEEFIASPAFDDVVLEALREGARRAEEENRRLGLSPTLGT